MLIEIDDKLISDIKEYCELNDVLDTTLFISKAIRVGFNSIKYGHRVTIPIKNKKVEPPKVIDVIKIESVKINKVNKVNKNIYGEDE